MRQHANLQDSQCRLSCQDLRQSGKALEHRFPSMPVRWGLPLTRHPGFSFCKTILLGRGDHCKPTQGEHTPSATQRNGFINFSEVSYGKTRPSYDRSEIAARKQEFLLTHQSGLPVEQASKAATACLPCYTPAASQRTSTPRRERRHDNNRRS